ncbi:dihydroxy-acid dehydratase [Paenibacillus allorhizosphaerae]|uniref:Dihydroxy-acid dehydratase n=1 Tax=Paenibacillus allorhizosphaerae TaxID=2849866 RepID=A0ABM8VB36_9BACL|nr:dihydroxy-acid dehydratase [Paenibacillus allorhizosphaerae]CAG7618357.1 Dihydroxy-acid dehydratase [Paenibacillus allorhizosphaerae]
MNKRNETMASQKVRQISFEGDALRMSMDWTVDDLDKVQVLVESTEGSSHPSSYHLGELAAEAEKGVLQMGGKPARYTTTDICDGIAQAHAGMHYSLASRDFIASMVEIHALATPFDAMVLSSAGDKAVPAHLMAIARLDIPAVHVPGGAMGAGPCLKSNEELWHMSVEVKEQKMSKDEFLAFQRTCCPTCGACQYMGTAATMQVMAEALGLALPWSALIPATNAEIRRMARAAGHHVMKLQLEGITPSRILTKEAFENAIMVHSAIGGSLNAVMHLIAIAGEVGIALDAELFDRIHRDVPVLVDTKTAGKYPTELFWYAGGVPMVMKELKQSLHLDCLTVTGRTVGDNLDQFERSEMPNFAEMFLANYKLNKRDVIYPLAKPLKAEGSMALLRGNLAPRGATIKKSAVVEDMMVHQGPARVFDDETSAVDAYLSKAILPGDVIVIRYQGPRAVGMPEMFYMSELIASDPVLSKTTALVTDGRFSGATRGPCIGYICPEAADGGAIALLENGDIVRIDIPARKLDVVGTEGALREDEEMGRIMADRRARWERPVFRHSGALGQYTRLAKPALEGGSIQL